MGYKKAQKDLTGLVDELLMADETWL